MRLLVRPLQHRWVEAITQQQRLAQLLRHRWKTATMTLRQPAQQLRQCWVEAMRQQQRRPLKCR
jgi:hypothetical protein